MTGIRVATSLDRDDVREIHLCAFREADGAVVGHIAFSPVTVNNNKRRSYGNHVAKAQGLAIVTGFFQPRAQFSDGVFIAGLDDFFK